MKQRNLKLDNLKGILIFLVVLGHLLFSYVYYTPAENMYIVRLIYCFHMPLFFIISGIFSKKVKKNSLFTLIILFLIVNLSYCIYDYIYFESFDFFDIKYSSWYLLYLFFYRLIVKQDKIKKIIIQKANIVNIILFCVAFFLGFTNLPIIRFFYFLFFFIFGYSLDLMKVKVSFYKGFRIFIIIMFIYFFMSFVPITLDFYMGYEYFNNIEILFRLILLVLNPLLFIGAYSVLSNKKLFFITSFGQHSLGIYVMHRIPTLIVANYLIVKIKNPYFILLCFVLALFICILFGNSLFYKYFINVLNRVYKFYFKHKKCFIFLIILFLASLLVFIYRKQIMNNLKDVEVVSYKEIENINNSFSIGYVGDLILLENQVLNSYTENGKYEFDYMFEHTKNYFKNVDYMIGVLEGPSDDSSQYSYGNFDDDKKLHLNYPSSFLASIKNNGFDLVSVANNHLLDRGEKAVDQTINNLNSLSLDYVGAYKNRVKVVNIENIKIGILAYTYGINYFNEEELVDNYWNLSGYLCSSSSKYLTKIQKRIQNDFNYLKDQSVDLIIVMPHYGTQFSNEVDNYQKFWNNYFVESGADIILGDHSHRVQPIYYQDDTIIVNSPGNYVNSYTDYDGDVSMMVKIYIDKNNKDVIGAGIIPLLTVEKNGKYTSVSVYDALNDDNFKNFKQRLEYANEKVTEVSMRHKIDIKNIEKEYYYSKEGYKKENKYIFEITDDDKASFMYNAMNKSKGVCFVGDSITEGTKNNYHPWYEELLKNFKDLKYYSFAKGGYTSFDIIQNYLNKLENADCDLVVINIGTNDIRYNMTSVDDYIQNIKNIITTISGKEIILLSPWRTYDNDPYLKENKELKTELYNYYDKYLDQLAKDYENVYFLDVNEYISDAIKNNGLTTYLLDGIHPNKNYGIKLYSFSTLRSN